MICRPLCFLWASLILRFTAFFPQKYPSEKYFLRVLLCHSLFLFFNVTYFNLIIKALKDNIGITVCNYYNYNIQRLRQPCKCRNVISAYLWTVGFENSGVHFTFKGNAKIFGFEKMLILTLQWFPDSILTWHQYRSSSLVACLFVYH